jgi:hypothetical protein
VSPPLPLLFAQPPTVASRRVATAHAPAPTGDP